MLEHQLGRVAEFLVLHQVAHTSQVGKQVELQVDKVGLQRLEWEER